MATLYLGEIGGKLYTGLEDQLLFMGDTDCDEDRKLFSSMIDLPPLLSSLLIYLCPPTVSGPGGKIRSNNN